MPFFPVMAFAILAVPNELAHALWVSFVAFLIFGFVGGSGAVPYGLFHPNATAPFTHYQTISFGVGLMAAAVYVAWSNAPSLGYLIAGVVLGVYGLGVVIHEFFALAAWDRKKSQ